LERGEREQPTARAIDPEMDYIKTRYAAEFRAAFRSVLSALPVRERNILNLYFVDGIKTDAIGKLYQVDGSTVRRWLGRLRQTILEQVRRFLADQLQIQPSEVESLMGLVRSRLSGSLVFYLRGDPGSG